LIAYGLVARGVIDGFSLIAKPGFDALDFSAGLANTVVDARWRVAGPEVCELTQIDR
jgi:hypothetical protein